MHKHFRTRLRVINGGRGRSHQLFSWTILRIYGKLVGSVTSPLHIFLISTCSYRYFVNKLRISRDRALPASGIFHQTPQTRFRARLCRSVRSVLYTICGLA